MPKRAKISRNLFIVAAVGAVAATIALTMMPKPAEVDLGQVSRGDLAVTIDEEGRTRVRETYIVSTPVAGRLLRVELHAGDEVTQGKTVVAKMRPTTPAMLDSRTREQAMATVDVAQAAVRVAQAILNAAIASEELAEAAYRRTRSLSQRGVESEASLERAEGALRASRANRETAEAAIAMREAELANARANLNGQYDDGAGEIGGLDHSQDIPLYSPIDGRILRVMQESETTLPVGAPIMEIGDVASDLEVVAELISSDAVQVREGDPVILRDWGGEEDLRGEVSRVHPFGETKYSALGVEEQRVRVEIDLLSPPEERAALGHGYRLEVGIIVWQANDILLVPASALFRENGQWSVFVAEEGVARLTQIEIGESDGVLTQVIGGLAEGAEVVLYPSAAIEDGTQVTPRVVN
ncbi:efflux RND transporter periplasmic adaptor subunit [Maritalea mediterranea]|uniref:HlyD family efflux transporter periplasmic adaptor subunit n=1 Tax=Maritalea mediterranea TaxID=2909667 RepID=A0ABS9EAB8_9HYPH|nr:HlyD family efflux transporter periplasmic adaptor subunit [Maritalea mediterranea]MCF4099815.1 HlyD family efflux transporter periplasmic adaptor subunit [Maritalea mediterranea]